MERREALKTVALLMGGTIIGTQAFLSGCQNDHKKEKEKVGDLFSESDIDLMNEVGDTIIPQTDTPGAKAAGIGSFMAAMLPDFYKEKDQKAVLKGLDEIRNNFEAEFGHSFMEGKPEERLRFLSSLEKEAAAYNENKKEVDPHHYFRILKELTLLGYFTSELGSTQALRYTQTPGRYDACIDYNGERAWLL